MLARKRREYQDMVPEFYDIENSQRTEDEIGALRQVGTAAKPHSSLVLKLCFEGKEPFGASAQLSSVLIFTSDLRHQYCIITVLPAGQCGCASHSS